MENKIVRPVITIDGPAASGKGTVTKRVAIKMGVATLTNKITN